MLSPEKIEKEELIARFERRFVDPLYDGHREEIRALAEIAWKASQEHHKAPLTRRAGAEFADPEYELSVDWLKAREDIIAAQKVHNDPAGPTRILLVSGSDRNDRSCAGEISKSMRLVDCAQKAIASAGVEIEVLDLSRVTSEYGKNIFPCKGCVSTAMPLCHFPCSCYPNYAADQVNDWMNDIYPMWIRAHGVLLVTPVYWNQAPSALKAMMDRMVCADGGNPDPTTTHGKKSKEAKALELAGWAYPRHLEGRVFATIVHGDTEGIDFLSGALYNWLTAAHMVPSSHFANTARYIGYYEPYADNQKALDKDKAMQEEAALSARALLGSARASRENKLKSLDPHLEEPRAK